MLEGLIPIGDWSYQFICIKLDGTSVALNDNALILEIKVY
jgi:hypothetical protein